MLASLFKKKDSRGEVKFSPPLADNIPYACHIDENTIITKNGELLQIIKVTGFSGQKVAAGQMDLRKQIRKAIKNIPNDNYALWFHTIRTRRNLDPGGRAKEKFAIDLSNKWKKLHNIENSYVNEVYISIIRDGISFSIKSGRDIINSFSYSKLKLYHEKKIDNLRKELNKISEAVLESLEEFGAMRLSIVENRGISYSEPISFFNKVINLEEVAKPMPITSIDEYLSVNNTAFGFNTFEIASKRGKKFGAIFTIKEYHEQDTKVLDDFLQLPQEFIITQTIDFVNSRKILSEFKRQKQILSISQDHDFAAVVGIDDILKSDVANPISYGESQITIMFIGDSLALLEANLVKTVQTLGNMGIVATRRDLRLEECFWSQLPANFYYVSRKNPINIDRIAGFASLYNFPCGKRKWAHWGNAASVFHTMTGNPYFFNFHVGDNGHTVFLGPHGSGKTVLLNFLISEARKYQGRLFFFDQERASKVFLSVVGGYYTIINPSKASPQYAFNPLLLEDNQVNRVFLAKWLAHLAQAYGEAITIEEYKFLQAVVEYIYSLPVEKRKLTNIATQFDKPGSGTLKKRMQVWHGTGKYAHLFDNERKHTVPFNEYSIYGFGMSQVVEDKITLGPILSYLLHRIEIMLDGTPTIIVLDEAWKLVNNPIFAPNLANWLDSLQQKNAIVIFATEAVKNASESHITKTITNKIATRIFLPNKNAEEYSKAYKEVWGLNDDEFDMLSRMSTKKWHFMIKQQDDAIVSKLDLSGMVELDILSGSDKTVTMMEQAIAEKGEDLNDWLPEFYKKLGK